MKINRLFEIIYLLLDKKTVTASELAQKFEVCKRTIYRDIETLCEAGIPIYTNQGKNGGIFISDNYVLDKSMLSDEEQQNILAGLQTMKVIEDTKINETLTRLSHFFHKPEDEILKIDFSNWGEKEAKGKFNKLKQAILSRNIISFDYFNTKGEHRQRRAEPIRLHFKSKAWYLEAYCLNAKDYRTFKVNRIHKLLLTKETFPKRKIPREEKIQKVKNNEKIKIVELELIIDADMAYRVYDEFDISHITKMQNGKFFVKIAYPEDEWVYGYLLSFGEKLKVVKPESIQKILKEKLEKMIKNY